MFYDMFCLLQTMFRTFLHKHSVFKVILETS